MAVYTTIDDPEAYFQVKAYTGTGSSQALTLDGDTDMQPDLVWIKSRSTTGHHNVFDSVRGTTQTLYSNLDEGQSAEANALTAFGSDGFTVGSYSDVNASSATIVAWCWKAGTTSGINTTGAGITPSAYSFNQTSGFSILKYTGTGSETTVAHGLAAIPEVIIIKKTSGAIGWAVKHKDLTADDYYLYLNDTIAQTNGADNFPDTASTSVLFSIETDDPTNTNTGTYVAYAFASKQGFSKFGSYVGNGNADGTFVYTGFRPAWVMIKQFSAAGNQWNLVDNKRDIDNPVTEYLLANTSGAEVTYTMLDFLSNGFKLRTVASNFNSASSYIYMAFAEAPFVNSNGVPCNSR